MPPELTWVPHKGLFSGLCCLRSAAARSPTSLLTMAYGIINTLMTRSVISPYAPIAHQPGCPFSLSVYCTRRTAYSSTWTSLKLSSTTNQLHAVTSFMSSVSVPAAEEIKDCWESCLIGIWRFTSTSQCCQRWLDRAVTMHKLSGTLGTCWLRNWHRRWRVVWSCQGSTIAMLCCTALQAITSRSYSMHRTSQLGLFSRHQDDPTPARCWGCNTGCPFSRGSTTQWLC